MVGVLSHARAVPRSLAASAKAGGGRGSAPVPKSTSRRSALLRGLGLGAGALAARPALANPNKKPRPVTSEYRERTADLAERAARLMSGAAEAEGTVETEALEFQQKWEDWNAWTRSNVANRQTCYSETWKKAGNINGLVGRYRNAPDERCAGSFQHDNLIKQGYFDETRYNERLPQIAATLRNGEMCDPKIAWE